MIEMFSAESTTSLEDARVDMQQQINSYLKTVSDPDPDVRFYFSTHVQNTPDQYSIRAQTETYCILATVHTRDNMVTASIPSESQPSEPKYASCAAVC